MPKEYLAGISIDGMIARIAVLLAKSSGIKVYDLLEVTKNSEDPLWYLEAFRQKNKSLRHVTRVSIALDDAVVVRHAFPLDTSLTSADRIGHIRWELSQVVAGFDPAVYLNDLHILRQDAERQVAETLIVAVPRTVITTVRDLLGSAEIGLHKVDTRYFGGQYALITNYPDIGDAPVCLCAFGDEKMDAGLIENGRVVRYLSVSHGDEERLLDRMAIWLGDIRPGTIYLWGSPLPVGLADVLAEKFSSQTVLLDPFRRLKISGRLRRRRLIDGREHQFAAAVGCALLK